MKSIGVGLRSFNRDLSRVLKPPSVTRTLATNAAALDNPADDNQSNNSFESVNEFERRIFGGIAGGNSKTDAFFEKIDRLGRGRKATGSRPGGGNYFSSLEGLDESFNTLSDGMDGKLKKAATYFEYDPEEIEKEDYSFRPDMNFRKGMTYDVKDLDLTKPGVRKPFKRYEFETTTEEVLKKADFRNVRFLANFLTKAGIIIKRSQTGISAKAQRKVAREIKTARAFGLMPFTLMGSKEFTFGKTMEDLDEDYEYESYENSTDADAKNPFGDFGV